MRRFADNIDAEAVALRKELLAGRVQWGGYHCFKIHDPKERLIHAPRFRDRVAHHAIMVHCEPSFEAYQISDSYACRKGRGVDGALSRTLAFARNGGWYLKMDIRKYFDTIDQNVLKRMIRMRFKDGRVFDLMDAIIETYSVEPGKGVPIGNLTSQFFANHYLAVFDRFVKERLQGRRYVRYMDDFVLWDDSGQRLKAHRREIESFLSDRLGLTVKPPCQNRCERGMTFLGYKVYPEGLRLARRSRQRFRRKVRLYTRLLESGWWDEQTAAAHIEPLTAFVKRAASKAFRRRVFDEASSRHRRRPEARTG